MPEDYRNGSPEPCHGYSKAEAQTCLDKCSDDEPVFLLRGQDLTFPLVVQHWIDLVTRLAVSGCTTEKASLRSIQMGQVMFWRLRNLERVRLPD